MSLKKVHDKQPEKFIFSEENQIIAKSILKKYPDKNKKSAAPLNAFFINLHFVGRGDSPILIHKYFYYFYKIEWLF